MKVLKFKPISKNTTALSSSLFNSEELKDSLESFLDEKEFVQGSQAIGLFQQDGGKQQAVLGLVIYQTELFSLTKDQVTERLEDLKDRMEYIKESLSGYQKDTLEYETCRITLNVSIASYKVLKDFYDKNF